MPPLSAFPDVYLSISAFEIHPNPNPLINNAVRGINFTWPMVIAPKSPKPVKNKTSIIAYVTFNFKVSTPVPMAGFEPATSRS